MIERLALAAAVAVVPIGADVVVQGEPAEHFYVIESGRFDVLVAGTTAPRSRSTSSARGTGSARSAC